MPGISFVYDFKKDIKNIEGSVTRTLNSLLHNENYKSKILYSGNNCILGFTGYDKYPVTVIHKNNIMIVIEGYIYDKPVDKYETELYEISEMFFSGHEKSEEKLSEWFFNTDGVFNVFIKNNISGDILILNDALGHLPLYYSRKGDILAVSREISFFCEFFTNIKIDKMSAAQFLLFSFTLGKRTLFENISRVMPSSFIYIKNKNSEFIINEVNIFNHEKKKYESRNFNENIDNLINLFSCASLQRSNLPSNGKIVLSLSGGLDSRSVAAGLTNNNIEFTGITFLDEEKTVIKDYEVAGLVAEALNIKWKTVMLSHPTGKDTYKLLKIKRGLNYLNVRFVIEYYKKIKEIFGPDINYFTGDSGMVLRDYTPSKNLSSLDEMVSYIFSKGERFTMLPLFTLSDVARLSGIDKKDIIDELKKEFTSYPEHDINQKFVHFVFSGYCFNWHYEGMDRIRCFFWLSSPLESTHFFNYSMNCPDSQKKYFNLYRAFLLKLSPQTAEIKNAAWNSPVNSQKNLIKLMVRALYNSMPSVVKGTMRKTFRSNKPYDNNSNIIKCLRDEINFCPAISEYFPVQFLLETAGKSSKREFDTVFTLVSLIENLSTGRSSIENYLEQEF